MECQLPKPSQSLKEIVHNGDLREDTHDNNEVIVEQVREGEAITVD